MSNHSGTLPLASYMQKLAFLQRQLLLHPILATNHTTLTAMSGARQQTALQRKLSISRLPKSLWAMGWGQASPVVLPEVLKWPSEQSYVWRAKGIHRKTKRPLKKIKKDCSKMRFQNMSHATSSLKKTTKLRWPF